MDLKEVDEALKSYIRPQSFPVAIRLLSSEEEIPVKARIPSRDLGFSMPLCQGIGISRRYGWVIAMGREDMSCPIGALTLGFFRADPRFFDGSLAVPAWIGDKEVRAKIARSLPALEYGKYAYLVAAPLSRADFEPQVIVVYGNPAQAMRLTQGAIYATGVPVTSQSWGGGACAGIITRTILEDACQLVLPGAGDRIFALTQDHEMAFTMPQSRVETMLQGLKATHDAGMRYPVTFYFMFKAEFPPAYKELMDHLKQMK